VAHRKRLLAALLAAALASVFFAPAPSFAAGGAGEGVYDPSSPAGDQYADPFERGRSAGGGGGGGGGDSTAPNSAPGTPTPAAGTAGPPTRQANAVPAFGAGVTRRFAEGSSAGGAPTRSHAGADRAAAADRALAASEIKGVDSSATGDLLLLAAISAGLVLAAALLGRLRRRNTQ
jgi:hypothetical protein